MILAHCGKKDDGYFAERMDLLLTFHLWDSVSMEDRRLFTEEGVTHDTPGGILITKLLCRLYKHDYDAVVATARKEHEEAKSE